MIREHKRADFGAATPFTPSLAPARTDTLQGTAHDRTGWTAAPVVGEVLRSSGRPLDPATRASMEPRLGHSFDAVRVHAGERAAASALALGALAYTVGEHVVLGPDAPPPGTPDGRRLIAHELVHVAQSRASAYGTGALSGVTVGDPHDAAEREAEAVAAGMNRTPGADGTSHPVGLAGRTVAGPVARRQLLPTTTVYGRADHGAFVVLGLRAEIDAAAREFAVPPELVGAIVLHESQAGERSFFGGAGLADLAERAEAFVSSDPSIGIGQMKVSLASGLRTRHPTLAGSGSVVGDLLDRPRAVRYVAAHLGELGGQIDSWLASQGVTPTAEERRDLIAVAYNMGWVSLRDRNLLDPGLGPDVPSRISALRSRNVYLNRTIGNLRLVTDALAGRRPSGITIRTLGVSPWWNPRYRR